jgi:hypothetical protein
MAAFPKEFFQLNLNFAYKIARHYQIPLAEAFYKYTSLYARLIGFSDTAPPSDDHEEWQKVLEDLPDDRQAQLDFIYKKYLDFEENKKQEVSANNGQVCFRCFSYFYNADKNLFNLHFTNADPQGNLGRDRVEERMKDFRDLAAAIKKENKRGAGAYMTSWLLSTEAMKRILPPEFIASLKPRNKGVAQDNGWWGQFIDRQGNIKHDLAAQLLENANEHRLSIDEYFPMRTMRGEVPQEVLFDFYLK